MYLGNVSLDVDANTKIVPKVFQMYYTHVHGPFEAVLCVGAFLPEAGFSQADSAAAYLRGEKDA